MSRFRDVLFDVGRTAMEQKYRHEDELVLGANPNIVEPRLDAVEQVYQDITVLLNRADLSNRNVNSMYQTVNDWYKNRGKGKSVHYEVSYQNLMGFVLDEINQYRKTH